MNIGEPRRTIFIEPIEEPATAPDDDPPVIPEPADPHAQPEPAR